MNDKQSLAHTTWTVSYTHLDVYKRQVPSVGADGEQPNSQTTTQSIAEETAENNPQEKDLEEMLRDMRRMNDPAYLHTVSMNDLYQNIYQSRPPVIDGLLYPCLLYTSLVAFFVWCALIIVRI